MKGWTYIDEMAFILLADAVASELEMSWNEARDYYKDIPDAKARFSRLHREVMRAGEDIVACLQDVCEGRGVDPTPFLSADLVKDFIAKVDAVWEGKATVAGLYEDDEKGAGRLILGGAGHGVDLGDDQDELDWLKEHGIEKNTHRKAGWISDMYHAHAGSLIEALMKKALETGSSA